MPPETKQRTVAILGASSHIAKGLLYHFTKTDVKLILFARTPEKVNGFLLRMGIADKDIRIDTFDNLQRYSLDVIINCVGFSDPVKIRDAGPELLNITEYFDECAISYLSAKNDTQYINMSSGAVFGRVFDRPVDEHTCSIIDINNIGPKDIYALAKIHAEVKHRAQQALHIVDIRVFSYFSRFADLDASFFLSEIITCIKNKSDFITTSGDMIRDYVHPKDLFSLVQCCIGKKRINDVFDVYSRAYITKNNILDYFSRQYGLRVVQKDEAVIVDATGKKDCYYSLNRKAAGIGYVPKYSSLETISGEAAVLLETSS